MNKEKILIFSEEYIKITKGLFVVWSTHALVASRHSDVTILLNHEHWCQDEIREKISGNNNIILNKLFFLMPSSFVKFFPSGNSRVLRGGRYLIGRLLTFILSPLIILYLFYYLKRNAFQAVFSHNGGWPAGDLCRLIIVAAFLARIPHRNLVIHNYPAKLPTVLKYILGPIRFLEVKIIELCTTKIISVSDSICNDLNSKVFTKKIHRIHNGIDLNRHHNLDLPELNWRPKGLTVGFVGALYPYKGPHVLIDAFRLVKTKCELALLGPIENEYYTSLQGKAEICSNPVTFLGFHQNVDAFMESIDFLVVPSIAFESFGMVVLEAMKSHLPVICSDFGGMKEIVKDGITGLVVPASNDVLLAEAIEKLLADEKLRNSMGKAGFDRLNNFFTAEIMEAQYAKLQ